MALKAVFLLSALFATIGHAYGITANEWQGMNSSWRAGYVAGVLDGWSEAASRELMEGKSDSMWIKAMSCITAKKLTYRQIVATTEKYVKEHPEEWHKEASTLVYYGMTEVCRNTE